MIIKYKFPGSLDNVIMVEMEYFCRGAAAMSSENFDWSSSGDTLTVFVAAEDSLKMRQKLEGFFGAPDSVEVEDGKVMCRLCRGHGTRRVINFDNGYQPVGFATETCCDCHGTGVR